MAQLAKTPPPAKAARTWLKPEDFVPVREYDPTLFWHKAEGRGRDLAKCNEDTAKAMSMKDIEDILGRYRLSPNSNAHDIYERTMKMWSKIAEAKLTMEAKTPLSTVVTQWTWQFEKARAAGAWQQAELVRDCLLYLTSVIRTLDRQNMWVRVRQWCPHTDRQKYLTKATNQQAPHTEDQKTAYDDPHSADQKQQDDEKKQPPNEQMDKPRPPGLENLNLHLHLSRYPLSSPVPTTSSTSANSVYPDLERYNTNPPQIPESSNTHIRANHISPTDSPRSSSRPRASPPPAPLSGGLSGITINRNPMSRPRIIHWDSDAQQFPITVVPEQASLLQVPVGYLKHGDAYKPANGDDGWLVAAFRNGKFEGQYEMYCIAYYPYDVSRRNPPPGWEGPAEANDTGSRHKGPLEPHNYLRNIYNHRGVWISSSNDTAIPDKNLDYRGPRFFQRRVPNSQTRRADVVDYGVVRYPEDWDLVDNDFHMSHLDRTTGLRVVPHRAGRPRGHYDAIGYLDRRFIKDTADVIDTRKHTGSTAATPGGDNLPSTDATDITRNEVRMAQRRDTAEAIYQRRRSQRNAPVRAFSLSAAPRDVQDSVKKLSFDIRSAKETLKRVNEESRRVMISQTDMSRQMQQVIDLMKQMAANIVSIEARLDAANIPEKDSTRQMNEIQSVISRMLREPDAEERRTPQQDDEDDDDANAATTTQGNEEEPHTLEDPADPPVEQEFDAVSRLASSEPMEMSDTADYTADGQPPSSLFVHHSGMSGSSDGSASTTAPGRGRRSRRRRRKQSK